MGVLICLVCMFFIFLSFQVLAEDIYKQNNEIDLKISCINENTKSYCSSTSICNITIYNPDSSLIVSNAIMQNQIAFHNYTLNSSYTNQKGNYAGNVFCVEGRRQATITYTMARSSCRVCVLNRRRTRGVPPSDALLAKALRESDPAPENGRNALAAASNIPHIILRLSWRAVVVSPVASCDSRIAFSL